MIRTLLQRLVRIKNPDFTFDETVNSRVLLLLAWDKLACLVRGWCKQLFHFRNPVMLLLGKRTRFFHFANIRFGRMVQLGDYVYLNGLGRTGIFIDDHTSVGAFSRLVVSTSFNRTGSHIRIGKHVGIGEFAYLGGAGGLDIGDECIIGQYFSCHPENHIYTNNALSIRHSGVTRKGIRIGSNCWIGARVTILDDVHIGNHCVIAAGAVVTRDMPDHSVIGGIPARVIKQISVETPFTSVQLENPSELFR